MKKLVRCLTMKKNIFIAFRIKKKRTLETEIKFD